METKLAELKELAKKATAVQEFDLPPRRRRLFPTARAATGAAVLLCVLLAAIAAYFLWFAPQVDDVTLAAPPKNHAGLERVGSESGGVESGGVGRGKTRQNEARKNAVAQPTTDSPKAEQGTVPLGPSGNTQVKVHVAGAVTTPGVYTLPAGARVVDAIKAAGGALPEADPDALNLARFLRDGERMVVPRPGEAVTEPQTGQDNGNVQGSAVGDNGSSGASIYADTSTSGDGVNTAANTVNVNQATATQLEVLPGIGPSLAARIVNYREQNGPFTSVQELLDVPGIGAAKFEALRGMVAVD